MRRITIAFSLVGCFALGTAAGEEVQLTPVATGFNSPIGIDHHPVGGNLLVVTTDGNAWRVSAAGLATRLASLGTHLEGLTTVPNDPAKYGPWAGHALAGAEDQGRIYAIGADGAVDFYELGVRPEDI